MLAILHLENAVELYTAVVDARRVGAQMSTMSPWSRVSSTRFWSKRNEHDILWLGSGT